MTLLPEWMRHYQRDKLPGDLTAGLIVTIMLIPQSLAYAMLAGLPPEMGLYASVLPLVAYALLGTSMTLAIGPVAVVSLMTASALQPLAPAGSAEYASLAIQLALLSGVMLLAFGLLRLGFLAHFLSHPVISGFISGSAILITVGQLKHLVGVSIHSSDNVFETVYALGRALPQANAATTALGLGGLMFLWITRRHLPRWLHRVGLPPKAADLLARLSPMVAVIAAIAITQIGQLADQYGVKVVGNVPSGWPDAISFPVSASGLSALWLPALLISLVGFVESVSVAQSLALRRRERINPNRELLGMGAANVASALSGGFPVTGGFSRSVVNFSAGANTPLSGVISAVLMSVVVLGFTHWFHDLPQAILAATIIVPVTGLIDIKTLKSAWAYDRADAFSLLATLLGVLLLGVEAGVLVGVTVSLGALVWRSSHPHMAVVGRVPGTEHFRNVERHQVETHPQVLAIRVDESLYFANASLVQDRIESLTREQPDTRYVLLLCQAVNQIDSTALEALSQLHESLHKQDIQLMLAEVKGPVMDRLTTTELGRALDGFIFLSAHDAFCFVDRNDPKNTGRPRRYRASF